MPSKIILLGVLLVVLGATLAEILGKSPLPSTVRGWKARAVGAYSSGAFVLSGFGLVIWGWAL